MRSTDVVVGRRRPRAARRCRRRPGRRGRSGRRDEPLDERGVLVPALLLAPLLARSQPGPRTCVARNRSVCPVPLTPRRLRRSVAPGRAAVERIVHSGSRCDSGGSSSPRIVREQGTRGLLARRVDQHERLVVLAGRAAEHDVARRLERVHEGRVVVPAVLLASARASSPTAGRARSSRGTAAAGRRSSRGDSASDGRPTRIELHRPQGHPPPAVRLTHDLAPARHRRRPHRRRGRRRRRRRRLPRGRDAARQRARRGGDDGRDLPPRPRGRAPALRLRHGRRARAVRAAARRVRRRAEGRARDRLGLDARGAAPRDRARGRRALRGDPRASAARRRSASCSS